MDRRLEFGIGFISGRTNVCDIINSYYKNIVKQVGKNVKITFFILYDLEYNNTKKEDYYNIDSKVYKNANVRHIGIEEIEIEKENIIEDYKINREDVDLFMGYGYARARNTIMYFALKSNIDYLLFWDDDEYPVACIKENNELIWKKQNNIAKHLQYIKKSNITFGHRCGYNAPIPQIDFDKHISEEDFKNFIDAVSNEAVSWENIKSRMQDNGITYANKEILEEKEVKQLKRLGIDEWLLGSGVCLNLVDIDKIPAFYNPPNARGEDTFFSTLLGEANVLSIPTYHFHDGFLKYTSIMNEEYPTKLKKIKLEDKNIEKRFLDATIGWIKYKPLLVYITHKKEYKAIINEMYSKLEVSIPKINEIFKNSDFSCLIDELKSYDKDVQKHYKEYIRTNTIWNKIKKNCRRKA